MNTFPSTLIPNIHSSETLSIPLVTSETEGNYPKVRRRTTKAREKFDLKFDPLTVTEWAILKAFFETNQGLPFTFVHPTSLVSYTCVIMQDTLEKSFISSFIFKTALKIEEV